MRYNFLAPALLFILLFLRENKQQSSHLPIMLSFSKASLPDSIQTFFKPYLQSKKIKVLEWEEVRALVKNEINGEASRIINSGNITKEAINNLQNQINPICSVLSIHIFENKLDTTNYIIDSIKWQISPVPAKDSSRFIKKVYIPENNQQYDPYPVLKAFLDHVLNSGYLK